jgi:hypothetical protein
MERLAGLGIAAHARSAINDYQLAQAGHGKTVVCFLVGQLG